eukprot:scaffold682_cov231-Pinguiococcus_pyrenoidosus.AAC.4
MHLLVGYLSLVRESMNVEVIRRHSLHLLVIMRDPNRGDSSPNDGLLHVLGGLGVQRSRRFVQQKQLRLHGQRCPQQAPLPLSSRKARPLGVQKIWVNPQIAGDLLPLLGIQHSSSAPPLAPKAAKVVKKGARRARQRGNILGNVQNPAAPFRARHILDARPKAGNPASMRLILCGRRVRIRTRQSVMIRFLVPCGSFPYSSTVPHLPVWSQADAEALKQMRDGTPESSVAPFRLFCIIIVAI